MNFIKSINDTTSYYKSIHKLDKFLKYSNISRAENNDTGIVNLDSYYKLY